MSFTVETGDMQVMLGFDVPMRGKTLPLLGLTPPLHGQQPRADAAVTLGEAQQFG